MSEDYHDNELNEKLFIDNKYASLTQLKLVKKSIQETRHCKIVKSVELYESFVNHDIKSVTFTEFLKFRFCQ
jgi:hypothetical protein